MNENVLDGFADPNKKLTGTVTAHVVDMRPDRSKLPSQDPQIHFYFITKFGNPIDVWLTTTNKKQCEMFLNAGILLRKDEGRLAPVRLEDQPWVKLRLDNNKVTAIIPIEYEPA